MTRTVCGRCEMDKCQCKTIGATGMTYGYTAYVSSGRVNSGNEVLRVTAEGEFIWNENADEIIESGDYSQYPALRYVLMALREHERLREALKTYGQHHNNCAAVLGGYQCTCGFNQQEQPK